MANQWNQWVLGYDMERQFAFLTRLGMEDITWQRMAFNMLAGIFLLVGIFTLILLRRLIVKQHDMVQATWLKACRKLAKVGLPRLAHEGAQDYANRVSRTRPDLAQGIQDIATRYTALRYKSESKSDSLNDFKKSVKAFKV
jgi:protein-glutamine gamma-glutamyltransferase